MIARVQKELPDAGRSFVARRAASQCLRSKLARIGFALVGVVLVLPHVHAQPRAKPAFDRAAHPDRMPPAPPHTVDRTKKSPASSRGDFNRAAGVPEHKPATVDRRPSPQSMKGDFKRAADPSPPPPPSGGGGRGGGGGGGGGDKGGGGGAAPPPGPKPSGPKGPAR